MQIMDRMTDTVIFVTVSLKSHTRTHLFNGPLFGTRGGPTRVSGTRKVKPIRILLKQETVSVSGISWAICKSAAPER